MLPSIYDGWGAVINEALTQGLYVICSSKCGAKDLIRNEINGVVFEAGNYLQLSVILEKCIHDIQEIRRNRMNRIRWAETHINGSTIAKYMVDNLTGKKVSPPWRR